VTFCAAETMSALGQKQRREESCPLCPVASQCLLAAKVVGQVATCSQNTEVTIEAASPTLNAL
jgi:hypothetical protein